MFDRTVLVSIFSATATVMVFMVFLSFYVKEVSLSGSSPAKPAVVAEHHGPTAKRLQQLERKLNALQQENRQLRKWIQTASVNGLQLKVQTRVGGSKNDGFNDAAVAQEVRSEPLLEKVPMQTPELDPMLHHSPRG